MYIGKYRIVQYDCPVVQLTERMSDLRMSVIGVNNSMLNRGIETIYVRVEVESDRDIEKLFRNIEKEKTVKKYEVVSRQEGELNMIMTIKKTKTMEASVKVNSYNISPWIAKDGVELWTLAFISRKQAWDFLSMIKESDYVVEKRVERVPDDMILRVSSNIVELSNLLEALSSLTERQRKVLRLAIENGFFDWPRRKNTSDLSKMLGISRVAVTKLLRKTEKRIFMQFLDILEKKGDSGSWERYRSTEVD